MSEQSIPDQIDAGLRGLWATIAAKDAEIARLTAERDADVVRMERATAEIIRLRAERDAAREDAKRMREALKELREHHVIRNTQVGRPIENSRTISIIDKALAPQENAG